MTAERLRAAFRAKPFRPFRIHLADGGELQVTHPELAWVAPDGQTAVVIWPQTELNIVDLPAVTRISRARSAPRRREG
ncbi:MAG: hypothetical protein HY721_32985 [Planctomycetes bacterium]|nr:hypothetical protein [Planctomycetota bacterium]